MRERWDRWADRLVVIGVLVVALGVGVTVTAYAQNDVDLVRRVGVLEATGAPERLARLEARLDSIQQLVSGVLLVVIGQVVVNIATRNGRR